MTYLQRDKWPAYIVGLLMGLLLTAVFAYGYQIGASSGIARISALIEQAMAPSLIEKGSYFHKQLSDQVIFNWRVLFVIGIFVGSLIATRLSRQPAPKQNTIWTRSFGSSAAKRYAAAFFGGVLLMVGARLANGCTSGHAISGGAQLAVVSWVFMIVLFAVAITTAMTLYKR